MLTDLKDPKFEIGMRCESADDVRTAIHSYAIKNRRDVILKKNDKVRIRGICKGNKACPWVIHVAYNQIRCDWEIRTYNSEHLCNTSHQVKYATAPWLAKEYMETIRTTPHWDVESFRTHVRTDKSIEISRSQAYRAKKIAETLIYGNHSHQYGLLRNYCSEVLRTNPGSTIKFEFEDYNEEDSTRQFKRLYCCLGALKQGFMAGCRKVLGFDGAFLKGPFPGQLLSAIGIDADNGMYPVAYAVVEAENKDAWKWFLELVVDDLQIINHQHWVFISDEQKGLVPAVQEVVPGVEHRWCLQHIFSNYRKEHRGQTLKECLFRTARATNQKHFQSRAKQFEQTNAKAYQWAIAKDPRHWCMAFWSTAIKSDISMNNVCESFNGFILSARSRAIISMLETIRCLLMKRIQRKQTDIKKQSGPLCNRVQAEFEKTKTKAMKFNTTWNGGDWYQVRGHWGEQFMVSLTARICTYGKWDLTGIPCKHVVSAIYYSRCNGGNGVAEEWVHDYYTLKMQEKIYTYTINPINGVDMWENQDYIPIVAPSPRPQPGRPRKLRRRDANEPRRGSGVNLGRKGRQMSCQRCGNIGHNLRGCRGFHGCMPNPMRKRQRHMTNVTSTEQVQIHDNSPVIGPISGSQPMTDVHSHASPSQGRTRASGSSPLIGEIGNPSLVPDVTNNARSPQGRGNGRGRGRSSGKSFISNSQPQAQPPQGRGNGRSQSQPSSGSQPLPPRFMTDGSTILTTESLLKWAAQQRESKKKTKDKTVGMTYLDI